MNFDDPDFSFQGQAAEKSRRKMEPPRRSTRKPGEPGWKVNGADEPDKPRWLVETDQKTGITTFTEQTPPHADGGGFSDRRHQRSIFRLAITSPCLVAGHHADAGSLVICYHSAAGDLLSSGNARVIDETRNAF
jgi:hypothetical protein